MFDKDHPTLADLQEYHRELDAAKSFDPDIYFNALLLQEEVGELAATLVQTWRMERRGGSSRQEALRQQQASLGEELADCLAYVIKLANYADIDLETVYLTKMRENLGRDWHHKRNG
jgi:NTP pyrophosphatase (non-canonical NTP hydrolase)